MTWFLAAGLIFGILAVMSARRNIVTWPRVAVACSTLAVAFFGFAPRIAIEWGLLEKSTVNVLFAIGYFFVFAIVSNIVLWGSYSRGQKARTFD